jgi:small subunit ribosomal protein S3
MAEQKPRPAYTKFVEENMKRVLLQEYLIKEAQRAGFGGVDIQRTPMGTMVVLHVERPGLVIGRKGAAIKRMTEVIESEFGFENPLIEVKEVSSPALNPQIMAEKLAHALEQGWHFRRAGHATVRRIMEAGARGCQVVIAGKLTGERHRTQKFVAGTIKYCGDTALQWMRKGFAVAKLKPGVMGITVRVMDPQSKLPDDIEYVTGEAAAKVIVEPAPLESMEDVEVVEVAPHARTRLKAVGEESEGETLDIDKMPAAEVAATGEAVPKPKRTRASRPKKERKVAKKDEQKSESGGPAPAADAAKPSEAAPSEPSAGEPVPEAPGEGKEGDA